MRLPSAQGNEMTPTVSVIMPCYNAAPFVAEAVMSALQQRHRPLEVVVVDDGSSDDSAEIVQRLAGEHPGRIQLHRQPRKGPYPARNLGLRHARGEFVAFLDADDYWAPDCIEKLHGALVARTAAIAYCGWQNVGDGIHSTPYVPPEYEGGDPVAHFLHTCPWPIHAALIRRSVVDAVGGFSEHRFSSMDYDFWLRALAATRDIVRVPEVLAYYRWHDRGQVSAVKWRQVLDALAAQQAFIRTNPRLVAHLPRERLRELTEGRVLEQAYRAFWKRDLVSAQHLFRHVAAARTFRAADLPHIISAMLPLPVYRWVVRLAEASPR